MSAVARFAIPSNFAIAPAGDCRAAGASFSSNRHSIGQAPGTRSSMRKALHQLVEMFAGAAALRSAPRIAPAATLSSISE